MPQFDLMTDFCKCQKPFVFNPRRVPTIPPDQRPLCRDCISAYNEERRKKGLPEYTVHEYAYKAEPDSACGQ